MSMSGRSDFLVHVGANLRRLRARVQMSRVDLAERSGVSRRTIVNVEAGEANVSVSPLDRLADRLGSPLCGSGRS